MEQKTLSVEPRKRLRSNAARRMRREGFIPAVIYGHGDPVHVKVSERDFGIKFNVIHESEIVTLNLEGTEKDVLIKDYQHDILSDRIRHIDFYEIERGKTLRTHISLSFIGTAAGTREGGIMETHLHEVEVECLPKDLPENIEFNVEPLEVGDSVHVSNLVAPEGVKILTDEGLTVLTVAHLKTTDDTTDEEEEAEEAVEE